MAQFIFTLASMSFDLVFGFAVLGFVIWVLLH